MDYLSKVMTAAIWGEQPPEAPVWNQWVHKSRGITHCETCLSLHGRWFLRERRHSGRTMPTATMSWRTCRTAMC